MAVMRLIATVFLAVLVLSAPARAGEFDTRLQSWEQSLAKIEGRVTGGRPGSLEGSDLRVTLQGIADAAAADRDGALKDARRVRGLLSALGPKPAEGEEPEAEPIRKQRQALETELAGHEGRAKQAELIIARAEQALAEIGRRSRERLTETLFERTVSPLTAKAWAIAAPEAAHTARATFLTAPRDWWSATRADPERRNGVLRAILLALAVALAGWPLGRWIRTRYGRVDGIAEPGYARRLLAGLAEGGGRALAPVLFVLIAGWQLIETDLMSSPLEPEALAATRNLVLLFVGYGLINAAFTPKRIEWRLMDFGLTATRLLVFRLKLTLIVFLAFDWIRQSTSWTTPSAELESVAALIFTLALVPFLVSLLEGRIWQTPVSEGETAPETPEQRHPRIRAALTLSLLALPVTAAAGYPALASHVLGAVVVSGLLLGGLGLLRSVVHEGLATTLDKARPVGRRVRKALALDEETTRQLLFWMQILADLGLLAIAGLALPPVWGLGAGDTVASAGKLLRGVQVGSYTLSLIDILIGLTLFGLIVLLTRLAQKGLERHILPNITKDKGVRDALKTGVGYLGVVIAGLVAISALGLDLTNLALIAGALSVGLGFGLQNVVNNFVSGLILLAERPIKPGDWVVIGGHEGTVKKVNVRSTEVETFQRASVIIPNADLIASPVINWTHKNLLGRVEVTVGVAYGSDPRRVEEILLEAARAHTNVIATPEPFVLFTGFGDSSLDFELRAYLSNVENRLRTASDLRYAIHDALRESGIEIPFPQRVVHMQVAAPAADSTPSRG